MSITPADVHKTIGKYMIADGFDLVFDLQKSQGCQIYNARTNNYMLDMFSFFASAPLGFNHPKLTTPEFIKKIGKIAVNKPTNSDIYTVEMAEFVDTFARLSMPPYYHHLFFISGGALAIENALKTAFDWKIRKNLANGKKELGTQIIHFQEAFHGRSGYTMSMTNTFMKEKIMYYPKFKWPRIINPKITFPLTPKNTQQVQEQEQQAVAQIEHALQNNPDDIAGLIIEPIQAEGGDNHFRKKFHQTLQKICNKNDIMFIVDEIQTGVGLTGKMWAHEHYNIKPDMLAFGKKTQVCGIMVGKRVDEIHDNVFNISSRLNSTWGGNLVDMIRCQKYLEIIAEDNLIYNAAVQGKHLLNGLEDLEKRHPDIISNARGLGLMCAFDLPSPQQRDDLKKMLYKQGIVILSCGAKTIRFRPPLIISEQDINQALTIIEKTIKQYKSNQ